MDSEDAAANKTANTDVSPKTTILTSVVSSVASRDPTLWDRVSYQIITKLGTSNEDFNMMCKEIDRAKDNDQGAEIPASTDWPPEFANQRYNTILTKEQVDEVKEKYASIVDGVVPHVPVYIYVPTIEIGNTSNK